MGIVDVTEEGVRGQRSGVRELEKEPDPI